MSKLTSLSEAIHQHVHDEGPCVCRWLYTPHPICRRARNYPAGHQRPHPGARHPRPDLRPDGSRGLRRKVIFSYSGNPGVGSLKWLRDGMQNGSLEWEEYSHFGMISRLQAGASGLPFMPMRQTGALDLEKANPLYRRVADPYGGEDVVVVPALCPDVAIVHVQRADSEGNAHIWGILGEQREAAFAAKRVILTAEEIVDADVIRSDPNRTLIPSLVVSAVCHVSWCAHPSYTQGYYDRDNELYLRWEEISKNEASMQAYLDEWVYGVKDREEYLAKLGEDTRERLKPGLRLSAPVNYGSY